MTETTAIAGYVVEPERPLCPVMWCLQLLDGRWIGLSARDNRDDLYKYDIPSAFVHRVVRIPAEGEPSQADALRACYDVLVSMSFLVTVEEFPALQHRHNEAIAQAEAALGKGER